MMKDFAQYEDRQQGSWPGDDGDAASGLKRFHRRHRREAELNAFDAGGDPSGSAGLPARLPEPWERLRPVSIGVRQHQEARSPLVNFFREDPAAKAFDLLRTRLSHTLKARGWKRVAVATPTSGGGATFTAVNLALSLARVPGSRTILMDMNYRAPGVATALKLDSGGGAAEFLQGNLAMEDYLVRPAGTLALGLADPEGASPEELIHGPDCPRALDDMVLRSGADAVLFDLPPVLEHDDLTAFLPQVDGVLLVSDGRATTAAHLEACEKMLAGHTELLGVVLNRARAPRTGLFAA